jgi:signal transduction histidine kinase/ActR/RegA family two-component response regulator
MVHEKCEHYRDGYGRIVRSVGMVHDVTERKRAEAELERSRQAMQRMVETSTRVMRETTVEGLLKAVSAAALELTGGRIAACGHGFVGGQLVVGGASRVPGAPDCPSGNTLVQDQGGVFMDLVGGADALRLTDAELRAHPRWRGPPQDHVPLRGLLGARMVGRQGETSGMILVTDKEGGEFGAEDESLLRQLGNIASLAAQHVEARLSLEESDRLKNQFLAMLSHELRNPLAPIRNSLRVLERAAPGGEQARRAQAVIDRQVGHMTRLVEDLLDVTRVSRGKILLKRAPLDLGEVVLRAVEDHRSAFVDAGIRLQTAIPYHPVGIHADRTRVVQVIGNLLENAVKFTQRGGEVSVEVETSWSLQQAAVRVRDTGAGIERGMLPRLFEPFTQADTTLDRSKGGLGLGLALVKALVEMHGGTVSVESEGPGRGAEFTVLFPLGAGALSPAAPAPGSAPGGVARRVLVIEDSVDAAESLREALELGEHAVEVAYSGAEGVERARTFRPEVVLCDIGLPGMDGYQVARAMRTDPALRETTLVALSGYATPDDVARAKAAGFDRHLAKPLDLEALERLFEELSADVARPGHQGRVTP